MKEIIEITTLDQIFYLLEETAVAFCGLIEEDYEKCFKDVATEHSKAYVIKGKVLNELLSLNSLNQYKDDVNIFVVNYPKRDFNYGNNTLNAIFIADLIKEMSFEKVLFKRTLLKHAKNKNEVNKIYEKIDEMQTDTIFEHYKKVLDLKRRLNLDIIEKVLKSSGKTDDEIEQIKYEFKSLLNKQKELNHKLLYDQYSFLFGEEPPAVSGIDYKGAGSELLMWSIISGEKLTNEFFSKYFFKSFETPRNEKYTC